MSCLMTGDLRISIREPEGDVLSFKQSLWKSEFRPADSGCESVGDQRTTGRLSADIGG